MQSHYYQANDGLQLHFLEWRHPSSHSYCLLLHGFNNNAHIWDGLAKKLSQHHNIIALDFRGHGDSDWHTIDSYNHYQLIEDVFTFVSELKISNLHIIGHSLGARIAMLLLHRKQIIPRSLVIMDTGPEVRAEGVNKVRYDAKTTPASFASTEDFRSYLSNIYILAEPQHIRHMANHGLKKNSAGQLINKTDPLFTAALFNNVPPTNTSRQQESSQYSSEELWASLTNIACPCLILRGQASAILTQSIAERMAYSLKKGELIIIPQAGHAMLVDNSTKVEEAIISFLLRSL